MASYRPNVSTARAAQRALDVRREKPPSQRGMTAVGVARARDLANRRPVSLDTVKRMLSFLSRHLVDKQGSTWSEQGKGWQAWHGWGGDAGGRWAMSVVRSEDPAWFDRWRRKARNTALMRHLRRERQ